MKKLYCMCRDAKCVEGNKTGRFMYTHQGEFKQFLAESIDECVNKNNLAAVSVQILAIQTGFEDMIRKSEILNWMK